MKVYVDNSVIGRLMDIERDIKRGSKKLEEDMAVLLDLIDLCAVRGIELFTSDDTATEIEKLRPTMPKLADALMRKLQSFTLLPIQHSRKNNSEAHYNMSTKCVGNDKTTIDFLADSLKMVLLDKTRITRKEKRLAVEWDAYHLAVCKDNDCEIFLTCDYASIWAYRKLLRQHFGIVVKRPLELFEEMRKAKG